ncbi:MAG: hypothetical protein ACKO1H_19250 [Tabrizicola sp.]
MSTVISLAVILVAAFGTEWLVDNQLGEDRREWVAYAAIPLMLMSGALMQASGVNEVTRILRNALLGAGIGAALRRFGLRVPLLRSLLRLFGVETEPETRPAPELRWSRLSEWLLMAGWGLGLVGLGMIWTGVFGG